MITIYKDRIIRIEWTILKGTSNVKEDFTRSLLKVFLIGLHDRYLMDGITVDGVIHLEIPQGMPEGAYSIEAVWVKNGGMLKDTRFNDRCIMRSRKDYLFAITEYESEATNIGEGEVVIRVRSSVATYGYDGLSAYEIATFRNEYHGSEKDFVKLRGSIVDTILSDKSPYPLENRVIAGKFKEVDGHVNELKEDVGNVKEEMQTFTEKVVEPDEEDITVEQLEEGKFLKLKDRTFDPEEFRGKGYKILRRNIVCGRNLLIQDMISESNTIYEIRYDFDLDGAQITIPKNCILKFDGGSLSNGKLTSIGYVRCINSDTPDYSNELKCDIDNNFVDKFPINPYSKLQQKNDTILTLNVGYWSKETPVEQPAQFINYIKSCGCIGITVVIALHNDEKGNIIRDYPENFYDYFHTNGVNIEAVKFHIDGGDYNGRDNVEFYRNYVNEVRDITRDFVGKNDVHAIFILNEWYEPTDERNKDMCNITRSLISDIKAWGFKVGISGYRGDKSNMPFDLFNKFDYKGLNIYPFFGLKDEFTTEENTDIYTPFNLLYNTMSSHGKYVANSITESGASESYYTLRNPADNTVKYGKNFTEYSPLIHLYNKGLFHFAGNLNPKFICTWYSKQLYLGKVEDLIKQYLF